MKEENLIRANQIVKLIKSINDNITPLREMQESELKNQSPQNDVRLELYIYNDRGYQNKWNSVDRFDHNPIDEKVREELLIAIDRIVLFADKEVKKLQKEFDLL